MLYRISNLTKIYHDRTVLDIPELDIDKGDICGLLGPNGAGKTTLLNILGFLDTPTTGDIIYESKPVCFDGFHMQNLRKTVSLVEQRPILFTSSVYKNLEFGLKIRRSPKKNRQQKIDEALDLVGMRDFADARANELSGGETQRIALARALIVFPEVLLCDEPTASVDVENQGTILNILKRINEEKKITLIFTTHDRLQASLLAKTILFLDHGRLSPSGNENSYFATLTPLENHQMRCDVQDRISILLPSDAAENIAGKIRIMIDPSYLSIHEEPSTVAGENVFSGKVMQVSAEKEQARIVVDIGIWISLLLPLPEYRNRSHLVGEKVLVHIPPKSVRVLR